MRSRNQVKNAKACRRTFGLINYVQKVTPSDGGEHFTGTQFIVLNSEALSDPSQE